MLVGEDSNGCQHLMLFVKINALYDTSGHVRLMLSDLYNKRQLVSRFVV